MDYLLTKYEPIASGKLESFKWRKLLDTGIPRSSKFTLMVLGRVDIVCFLMNVLHHKEHVIFLVFLPKVHDLNLVMRNLHIDPVKKYHPAEYKACFLQNCKNMKERQTQELSQFERT